MRLILPAADAFQIHVSNEEMRILLSGLAQITNIIGREDEIRGRLGYSKDAARDLQTKINAIVERSGQDSQLLNLSKHEVKLLVVTMSDLANGWRIYDWEFQTIVGANRGNVRRLLTEVHRLLVNSPTDLTKAGTGQSGTGDTQDRDNS